MTEKLDDDQKIADLDHLVRYMPPPAEAFSLTQPQAEAVRRRLLEHPDAPKTVGDVREQLDKIPDNPNPRASFEQDCLESMLEATRRSP